MGRRVFAERRVNIVVAMSDAKASNNMDDVLSTYSLGSCIGVAVYDAHARVGGLLHYQLPASSADLQRARERPLMFADTGMQWLMGEVQRLGGQPRRLRVRLAGGAQMLNDGGLFDIGRRNHAAIRKILWQLGLFIEAEYVGGTAPRTLMLNVGNGALLIKSGGENIAA
jgi:chemotaxis protein CheD